MHAQNMFLSLLRRLRNTKRDLQPPGLSSGPVTDGDIRAVGPILQRIIWAEPSVRERIQEYGVNVTPINFYSNTPSLEDIKSSFEYTDEGPPYSPQLLFDPVVLREALVNLTEYSSEFDPDLEGDEDQCDRFFWGNSQFSYSDAMAYYCFTRKLKPATVVEIGSGFSTLVAIEALRKNGAGAIICVEPYPRPFLERNPAVELIKRSAQDLSADYLNQTMQDGDILFIDSTHTVKTGSDCLHIYLRLLPLLKRNIYVHVHDVFLPFGLPMEWLLNMQIFWTEQYLLMALLVDNPKATVCYGSAYHNAFEKQLLDRLMHNRYPSGGGSFWFEYKGRLDSRA